MSVNKSGRGRGRSRARGRGHGIVPLIDYDRREGSVLYWDLDKDISIARNTQEEDVVLYHKGEVSASFTVFEASDLGERIYTQAKDSGDEDSIRYARALCSASGF